MKKFSKRFSRTAIAVGVMCATAANAQIEEIIVTAEFRENNVQDTPIAITAVNSEMLEARNQTSIYQVAAQAPNVTLQAGGQSRSGMVAFIRGIGQNDFNYALEPGVGIYVDDVYYSTLSNSLLELIDLERVEILRGPQGTLAGRNSIGGAIKLYSKRPGDGGGRVQVKYGSYNEISTNASGDFTILEGSLYGRAAIASSQRDGYVDVLDYGCVYPGSGLPTLRTNDGCKTGEYGDKSYVSGRISLLWDVNEDLDISFIADKTNDSSGAAAATLTYGHTTNPNIIPIDDGDPATPTVLFQNHQFVPYGPFAPANAINDPYVAYSTHADNSPLTPGVTWKPVSLDPVNTLNSWGLSTQIDWDINDSMSLTSITSYREYSSYFNQDEDLSPIAVSLVGNRIEHWGLTQEVRLNGTAGDVDYTVGGYYLNQEGIYEGRIDLNYAGLDFIHGPDPTPSTNLSVFAHTTWHATDRLNLSLGVRWSDDEKDYTHSRTNPDGTVPFPVPPGFPGGGQPNWQVGGVHGLQNNFSDDRVDYRVAVDYALNDNSMIYGQVSTGYKGGGVNPRPFFPEQAKAFQPEELTSYELGYKSTLLDNRLRLNGAIFFNEYDDIQLTLNACEGPGSMPGDPPTPPCLAPRNVGSAEVEGAELEIEYYPTDNFSIDASISQLDFQYQEVDPFALQSAVIPGIPIIAPLNMISPYTPELKWSLGMQYNFAPTRLGEFSARVDASYTDEIYVEATNSLTNRIEDYTLVNARVTWESPTGDWLTAFEVNNLTDEIYYLGARDQASAFGAVKSQIGLPRTFAVSIRRNFE